MPLEPAQIKQEAEEELGTIDAQIETLAQERKEVSGKITKLRDRKKELSNIIKAFTPRAPRQRRTPETTEPEVQPDVSIESNTAALPDGAAGVPASGTGVNTPAAFAPS